MMLYKYHYCLIPENNPKETWYIKQSLRFPCPPTRVNHESAVSIELLILDILY